MKKITRRGGYRSLKEFRVDDGGGGLLNFKGLITKLRKALRRDVSIEVVDAGVLIASGFRFEGCRSEAFTKTWAYTNELPYWALTATEGPCFCYRPINVQRSGLCSSCGKLRPFTPYNFCTDRH